LDGAGGAVDEIALELDNGLDETAAKGWTVATITEDWNKTSAFEN